MLLAAVAGYWLLRPAQRSQHLARVPHEQPVTAQTSVPEPTQTPPAEPTASATIAPAPSASPSANPTGPRLAIIVDDCGQWLDTERGFIALDIPLTMSVLPSVHYTALIAREASAAGKGVMLHLPMEPLSHIYPGPGEITTAMSDADVIAQTETDIAQVPLAAGVNNHEGSAATADARIMRDVVGVLAKHHLFFIDSRTNAATVGAQSALDAGIPTASRDVFLDNKADVAYSEQQLREAAAIAKRTGSAIAIGHPRPTTLEAVRLLIPELRAEGIQFVLASDLVAQSTPLPEDT